MMWCIFDMTKNIDFDREVRKISGDVEEANDDFEDIDEEENIYASKLDATVPGKKDISFIKSDDDEQNSNQRVTSNIRIVRMTKEISTNRH